jgi:hypothetical protein
MKRVNVAQIKTTQGRLYTTLWKGLIDVLFEEKAPDPTLPMTALQVTRSLGRAVDVAVQLAQGSPTFVMIRDISNSVSLDKYHKVLAKLGTHMAQNPITLSPKAAGLLDFELIAPTVEIALFPTMEVSATQLEALVKEAVYVPSKDAKKDMFRLSAHGLIV